MERIITNNLETQPKHTISKICKMDKAIRREKFKLIALNALESNKF